MKKFRFSAAVLAALMTGGAFAQQGPIQFQAKGILALSDADMTPSALVDNNLYRGKNNRDQMTIVTFPLNRNGQNMASLGVSNSAALYDKAAAVTPNGRLAFVLEGYGQISDSLTTLKNGMKDYPAAARLFIVDMTQPLKPAVKVASFSSAPSAVSMNPQGTMLVIGSGDAGKEIRLLEFDNTGKPTRNLTTASPVAGQKITDLAWHPSGQFIAYTVAGTGEVGLLKMTLDQTRKPTLAPHGKTVKVGTMPATGRFTPDGNFFIVSDIKKEASGQGAGKGEIMVVQFSTEDTPGEHKLVGTTAAGESAEALAVSPDGATLVVVNANQSYQPYGNPAAGKSSISVYSIGKDGQLALANEYPLEGVAPQSVDFDKSGNAIAVGVSEYVDYGDRMGGIEFFKVNKGDKPSLERMPGKISVPRGVHTVKVF
ncbi:beta-propeller fold lactonase family protein [Tellurirhabdus rosea]|uniref:beta-propeller fold lactonase family protein n=1 Tax=Tellurirhabdus rosea TaxID=2674997 RepID=UPI00225A6D71|nr:WD40 repeat domain-containing protein [Tellurirhabdus rosea]